MEISIAPFFHSAPCDRAGRILVGRSRLPAELRGRVRPKAAYVYRDFGNLATIGRLAAVVDLRGLRFSGMFAWLFWLAAHVFFLIGFRNRFIVLTNWAWAYLTYQRHARIVLGGGK